MNLKVAIPAKAGINERTRYTFTIALTTCDAPAAPSERLSQKNVKPRKKSHHASLCALFSCISNALIKTVHLIHEKLKLDCVFLDNRNISKMFVTNLWRLTTSFFMLVRNIAARSKQRFESKHVDEASCGHSFALNERHPSAVEKQVVVKGARGEADIDDSIIGLDGAKQRTSDERGMRKTDVYLFG